MLVLNVNMLQQANWRDILNINTKISLPPMWVWAATLTANALKIHVEYRHKGVRYPCSKCDYTTTAASNLKINMTEWSILAHIVSMLQLKELLWINILKVSMKEWDFLALNSSMLQLWQMLIRYVLKINTKAWDILVLNATMLQLKQVIWKKHVESKHKGVKYP